MLHIKLKRIRNAANGSKYFARRLPHPTWGCGQLVRMKLSEQSPVAYQIEENQEQQQGSKYFACRPSTPPPPPPPPTLGYGVKKSEFKYFACRPPSPLTLGLGSKSQNSTLSEHGHVAYQIKGIMNTATWYQIFCRQTPPPPTPWGWGL